MFLFASSYTFCSPKVGYTQIANYNETWTKQKFPRKNCKFAIHDENCATHYSSIVQSFAPWSTSSVRTKNDFEFVTENARLAKQHKLSFSKHNETPSTYYSWYVPILLFRPSFIVVCE